MTEFLEPSRLQAALSKCTFGKQLYVFKEIDSTNDFIKKRCLQFNPAEGLIVIAEKQTKGRGRYGRQWDSPQGLGLWFSVLFLPDSTRLNDFEWMQLGVRSCRSGIRKATDIQLEIHWPNDLYFSNKKVAGILTELVRGQRGIRQVVMGIGINVNQTVQDFSPSLREKAISLRMISGRKIGRIQLLVKIVHELEHHYRAEKSSG